MGFRFRKSVNLGPFRLNFSKSGVGYSVGGKFARYTKKANGGTRTTYTVPGTGVSYVKEQGAGKQAAPSKSGGSGSQSTGGKAPKKSTIKIIGGILAVLVVIGGVSSCMDSGNESQDTTESSAVQETIQEEQQDVQEPAEDQVTSQEAQEAQGEAQNTQAEQQDEPEVQQSAQQPQASEPEPAQPAASQTPAETPAEDPAPSPEPETAPAEDQANIRTVYITPTGSKYHYDNNCNGGTYIPSTLAEAQAKGLTPCKKCAGG